MRTKGPALFVDTVFYVEAVRRRDFVWAVLEKCPVDGKYRAASLSCPAMAGEESEPLLQSLKCNPEILGLCAYMA